MTVSRQWLRKEVEGSSQCSSPPGAGGAIQGATSTAPPVVDTNGGELVLLVGGEGQARGRGVEVGIVHYGQ